MAKHALPSGRRALAALAGAGAAGVGALILGEYSLSGATPYVAGLLFGLAVAEITLAVARAGSMGLAVSAAAESGLGLLWAAWISSGRGVAPLSSGAWVAVGLGATAAGGWVALPAGGARRTRPAPTPHARPRAETPTPTETPPRTDPPVT